MKTKNQKLFNFLNENIGKSVNVYNCGFEFNVKIESVGLDGNVVLNNMFKFNVCLFDNISVTSKCFAVYNIDPDTNEIEFLEIEVLNDNE